MTDRELIEKAFGAAITPLMGAGARILSHEPMSQADAFRAKMITQMMEDLGMMRDCLLDTFDVSWAEYSKRFGAKLDEVLEEKGVNKQ